ncbi:MAG: hypothetical protein R2778_17280 [Saprospiraceae bacterium]|nr:hypothetical protein [Saprospiraceae bacterium]MCB9343636.1 hypothetical protein [Lewinellaceae bacterium]
MNTPVLLLFFNRPDKASLVLERVRLVKPKRLYLHVDGPRESHSGELEQVAACRALQQSIDWPCTVFTLFRERNMGLRDGVSGALNWFFEAEEEGIVLEDDCLPDPSFFTFCEILLEKYRDNEQVMHIAGTNLAHEKMAGLDTSFFFSRFNVVWGWASWRRAWNKMTLDLDGLDDYINNKRMDDFIPLPAVQAYLLNKFRKTRSREQNSWAYAWFFSTLKHKGICIVPAKNLVENVGVGVEDATNTGTNVEHLMAKACSIEFPLKYPESMEPRMDLDIELFYHSQKSRLRLLIWFLLYRLGLR